jgi:RNA polymerase sigma-70 factor (ECF subfamily)
MSAIRPNSAIRNPNSAIERFPLTSARLTRLLLIAGPDAGRRANAVSVAVERTMPEPRECARIEPTVTQPPFDALEAHVGMVYRYAMRLSGHADLAEDITQETLLRAWRRRHNLREPLAARVWLLRITGNVWTDYLRQKKFRPRVLEVEATCPRPSAGIRTEHEEHVAQALAAMDELPPRQRQVLYLTTCEGLSQAEVADVLGIGPAAVKSNLSLARREMRRRLKDLYEDVCGQRTKK